MKIGDEVYVHGYIDEIRNDVVIIRNDGGYFGTIQSEVAKYVKPHIYGKQADAIIIDEPNSSEKPNNCDTCKHNKLEWYSEVCDGCSKAHSNYEPQMGDAKPIPLSNRVTHIKDEPQICDTCRYYNSHIPCGSTPSACKEADKFAEEFVDGLKKLKPKDEPSVSEMPTGSEPQKWETPPKFEHKGIQTACVTVPMALIDDEPQTDCDHRCIQTEIGCEQTDCPWR